MKKISIGSFPLINIRSENRTCIDKYLIKVLSDLITNSQTVRSITNDRTQYITPFSILNGLGKEFGAGPSQATARGGNGALKAKRFLIKNAFDKTKKLYGSFRNDPFYRDGVFFPIYLEEKIKGGRDNKAAPTASHEDTNYYDYKYDFLLLTNDLVKKQVLDEINYDDRVTILFMVLKDQLFPYTKLSEIGATGNNKGGYSDDEMRRILGVYLETCKNQNVNPIDMLIGMVHAAGQVKQTGGKLSSRMNHRNGKEVKDSGIMGELKKLIGSSPNSFNNLFGSKGEIKNANFLITLAQSDIQDYLHASKSNGSAGNREYNNIDRQYLQSKTHEYSRILSVVDALMFFNSREQTLTDLDSHQIQSAISVESDGTQYNINIDAILNDLEVTYFREFIIGIKKDVERSLGNIKSSYATNIPMSKEDYAADLSQIQTRNQTINSEVNTELSQINKYRGDLVGESDATVILHTEDEIRRLEAEIQAKRNEYSANQDRFDRLSGLYLRAQTAAALQAEHADIVEEHFRVDFSLIKAQLTGLYAEIYSYFSDDQFLKDIQSEYPKSTLNENQFKSSKMYDRFRLSLEDIAGTIYSNSVDALNNYLSEAEISVDFSQAPHNKVLADLQVNLRRRLDTTVFTRVIKPVFTKYANKSILDSEQLKNLRAEKNPVLRKMLSKKGLFKAFILNYEVIIGVYDILHFIDTQKFQSGLIDNPVSNVTSDVNKMHFVLQRFGLIDNPVFIIGRSNVFLNMPNHLSQTGASFISSIAKSEMLSLCQIDFKRDLWDQNLMFGGKGDTKKSGDLQKKMEKLQDEIQKEQAKINGGNLNDKAEKQARSKIQAKENEIEKKEEQYQKALKDTKGSNLTTNLTGRENDREYEWKDPNPRNERYDHRMSASGLTNDEVGNIARNRHQMDSLSDQRFPKEQRVNKNTHLIPDQQNVGNGYSSGVQDHSVQNTSPVSSAESQNGYYDQTINYPDQSNIPNPMASRVGNEFDGSNNRPVMRSRRVQPEVPYDYDPFNPQR